MTIVVGYVPTPQGDAALTAAISEAQLRNEALHVVNTSRGDAPVDNRLASQDQLAAVRDRLDASGVTYEIEQKFQGDDPAAQLVELADRLQASLLVIGIRRRTPTGKLLTGSQAQRILLDANCPVLAVKASS
jgi:nucleotide-binding universal stress UspA family protein